MGIFSTIFNWVLNKIFAPVFNFIGGLISDALTWLFNAVLAPLLEDVLWPLIKMALELVFEIIAGVVYSLYAEILSLVDLMCSAFDVLSGLQNVTYKGQEMSLLEAVFQIDGFRNAYWYITFMGLLLAGVLAIYATIKSAIDLDFENKRPVSRVLSAFFKCFIQLFTVEFVIFFVIQLSVVILRGVNTAMYQISGDTSGGTTLGRMVFVVSSFKASRDEAWNLGGANAKDIGIFDKVRKPFYELNGGKSYLNKDQVNDVFYFSKFDYVIGIALALFLLVIMACCLIVFVQRIFDMLLLYLVSPLFVGMIPLDDGEKFGSWRNMFIGKCFSGFGMVMAMKMYLMLCPSIMSGSIKFVKNSVEMDYLTKMVFLLGGAWAVLKSGNIITSLISAEAGSSETTTAQAGMAGAIAVGGGAISLTAGAISGIQAFRNARKEAAAGGTGNASNGLGQSGNGSDGNAGSGDSSGGTSASGGYTGGGTSASGLGLSGAEGGSSSSIASAVRESSASSSAVSGLTSSSSSSASGGSSSIQSAAGLTGSKTSMKAPVMTRKERAEALNAKKARNTSLAPIKGSLNEKTGKREFALRPGKGKLLNIGKDGKGNFNVKLLGFGLRFGPGGKINKISLPTTRIKRNKDGELYCDKVSVWGCTCKYNENQKDLAFRDFSLLGIHRKLDANGDYSVTNVGGNFIRRELGEDGEYHWTNIGGNFIRREAGEDGKFHLTSIAGGLVGDRDEKDGTGETKVGWGAVKVQRAKGEDGKSSVAGVRILGMNFYNRDEDK